MVAVQAFRVQPVQSPTRRHLRVLHLQRIAIAYQNIPRTLLHVNKNYMSTCIFFFRTCMSKKMHVNMRPLFLMFGTVEGKGSLESFHISRTNDMHGSRQELDDNEQRIQPRTKQERGGRA